MNVTEENLPIINANIREIIRKRSAENSFAKLHVDNANLYFRHNNNVRILNTMYLCMYYVASVMTGRNILKQL